MECEVEVRQRLSSTRAVAVLTTTVPAKTSDFVAPALRVSFSWTLVGNVIYAACQFGMLSSLAKLGSPSIVGQYALALAISAPVFMLTNLQLRGVQATDARHEYGFSDYFSLRAITTSVGILVVSVVTALAHYDTTTKMVILLVAGAKAVESISDVIAGQLQKYERLDQVARALIIRGVTSVVAFTLAFWRTHNLVAALVTLTATWIIVIALYDLRIVSRLPGSQGISFHFSSDTLKSLVSISWPLGLVMALLSLNNNAPRYILERKLGTSELGIFASLAYLLTAMMVIVVALGQAVCARLSRLFAHGNMRGFNGLMTKLVLFAGTLGVIGVALTLALGRPVLTLAYRAEYAEHVNLLLLMVVDAALVAIGSFLGFGMTSARCFRPQVPIMAASVIATVALTLALVPQFGLMGAGYALLVGSIIRAGASFIVLKWAVAKRVQV